MKTAKYLQERLDLLMRARESARVLDQATAARVAKEMAESTMRIAPKRVDPPVAPAVSETPAASAARIDPFSRAIDRRIQLGK